MNDSPVAEWCHVDTLTPWARNPRINTEAIPKVAASIRRHGFPTVITVWAERDVVLAGHTRREAVRALLAEDPAFTLPGAPGPGFVPVRRCSFASEHDAELFALADNRLGEVSRWDTGMLSGVLADLSTSVGLAALNVSGFDADDVLSALDLDAAAKAATSTPTGIPTSTPTATTVRTPTSTPALERTDLPVKPPTLVLVAMLVNRAERSEILQYTHTLCATLFPGDTPEDAEAMPDSPRFSQIILHALRRATS